MQSDRYGVTAKPSDAWRIAADMASASGMVPPVARICGQAGSAAGTATARGPIAFSRPSTSRSSGGVSVRQRYMSGVAEPRGGGQPIDHQVPPVGLAQMRDPAARQPDHDGFDHRQGEQRRDGGLHGIAAGQQHFGPRGGGQRMVGCDDAARPAGRLLFAQHFLE